MQSNVDPRALLRFLYSGLSGKVPFKEGIYLIFAFTYKENCMQFEYQVMTTERKNRAQLRRSENSTYWFGEMGHYELFSNYVFWLGTTDYFSKGRGSYGQKDFTQPKFDCRWTNDHSEQQSFEKIVMNPLAYIVFVSISQIPRIFIKSHGFFAKKLEISRFSNL